MEDLGIKIEFLTKDLEFDKSVAKMNKSINILKKEISMLNKELKLDPKNVEALERKFKNLQAQEKIAQQILDEYLDELEALNEANVSPFSEQWNATMSKVEEAKGKLVGIQTQLKNTQKQLDETGNAVTRMGENFLKAGNKMEQYAQMLKPVSDASLNILKTVTQESINFQDAFADVQKTVNATPAQFQRIEDGLRDLAKQVPTTATELAKIAGLAGQMNVPAEQIVGFTKAMVDFANSTNISAEEAVTEIAQIYNVIGKGGDFSNLDNLLSTIVELGNNSATTERDIVEMFRNISAGASRVDFTEQQMVALASTLSSLGLDKGGASAISKIMTNIDMAVDNNSKTLTEWAKVAQMSVTDFRKLWEQDASAGLIAVTQGIAKTVEEGGSFNQVLDDLGIREIRQIDTLSRLVNANEVYADAIKMANDAYKEGTALNTEATKRYKTVASQILILKNNFMDFAISLGNILLPYIEKLINLFQNVSDFLNNLEPHTKKLIARILVITASLTPLLLIIGKILITLGTLIISIIGIWNVLKNFLLTFGGIMAKVAEFVLLHPTLMGAIVALTTAFLLLYNNCKPFKEWVDNILKKIRELWIEFKQTNWIEKLGEKFGWLGEMIGFVLEVAKKLIEIFAKLIGSAGEFLGLSSAISSVGLGNSMSGTGMFSSGGFMSGSVTVNNNFTINGIEQLSQSRLIEVADVITDRVNENLGRMYA